MGIKEFLKPDWRKAIIYPLFVFFGIIILYSGIYYSLLYSLTNLILNFPVAIYYYSGLSSIIIASNVALDDILFKITFFLAFIYQYLLSCLIVWIYDKYFKKVKKR